MSNEGFSHIGLSSHYLEKARDFYVNVSGFRVVRCDVIKMKEGVSGTTGLHLCFGYAAVVKNKAITYELLADLISIEAAQPNLDLSVLARLLS
jgi:catechol 2,3-dioxygenase-like lactoylglutathione lyase family enzyme